jgi:hypothetical protein
MEKEEKKSNKRVIEEDDRSNDEAVSADQDSHMQNEDSSEDQIDDDKIALKIGKDDSNENHIEMSQAELNMTQITREKDGGPNLGM